MDGLRLQLEGEGLKDVAYIVVNHQGEQAQRLHSMMAQRLSENITLYKQDDQQPDVWQALNGEKDDFLIYDRCGRLTNRISLPHSIIGLGHIEGAIKDAYCKRVCGECTYESAEIPEECKVKVDAQPDTHAAPPGNHNTDHAHSHNHGHHHHGHGHGHHGDHHDHPRDFGNGHDHNHGHHHHGNHGGVDHGQNQQGVHQQEHNHDHAMSHGQHHAEIGQQQAEVGQVMAQQAHVAPPAP